MKRVCLVLAALLLASQAGCLCWPFAERDETSVLLSLGNRSSKKIDYQYSICGATSRWSLEAGETDVSEVPRYAIDTANRKVVYLVDEHEVIELLLPSLAYEGVRIDIIIHGCGENRGAQAEKNP